MCENSVCRLCGLAVVELEQAAKLLFMAPHGACSRLFQATLSWV